MGFFKKKKSGNGIIELDEIYGYFDEVIKQRKEIEIKIKKKTFQCGVYQIEEKKKSLRIQDKGLDYYDKDPVKCGFSLDNTWFSFNSTLLIIDDKPYILIPDEIVHKERRKHKRVSFAGRENTKISILESFGKGVGITGSISNISLSGICVEIERAIIIESEREVSPQANLLETGKKLGLVRINGISTVPEIDTTGTVHEMRRGHKWNIAIELPKFKEDFKNSLERFIESRSRDFTLIRRSRKKRLEAEKQRQEEINNRQQEQVVTDKEVNVPGATSLEDLEKENKKKKVAEALKKKEEKKKNLIPILIVGKALDRDLFFLRKFTNFEFFIAEDIPDLLKNLSEHSPNLLFIPHLLKDQNMINILIKISQKGVLHDIRVFLFIEKMISENDVIKCKTLGIESILKLPIKDPLVLIKKISKKTN